MEKLNKIEKRLEKLSRVQKQLEKKRKKLTRLASKTRKQSAAKTKKLASKVPASVGNIVPKKKSLLGLILTSVGLAVFSTVVAVAVTKMIERAKVQKNAYDRNVEGSADLSAEDFNTDYEKASLEELEEALLKVENQLDEVTAAIEKNKK